MRINEDEDSKRVKEPGDEEKLITTEGENEKVTQEKLLKSLTKIITDLNAEGKRSLEGILRNAHIEIRDDGKTILCQLTHSASLNEVNKERTYIMNKFREDLNNDALVLEAEIVAEETPQSTEHKKVFTNKDRYEKLSEKNKHLKKLKDLLNLDFDF